MSAGREHGISLNPACCGALLGKEGWRESCGVRSVFYRPPWLSSLTGARKAHQRPGAWLLGSVIAQVPSGPKSSSVALAMGDPKAPKQVRATCMPENNDRTKEDTLQLVHVHSASSTALKGDSSREARKKKRLTSTWPGT